MKIVKTILIALALTLLGTMLPTNAYADSFLQSAESFAILGGSAVTNIGPTTITGDLGVYSGTSLTGTTICPGAADCISITGTVHPTDAVAAKAQADLTHAINVLNLLVPTVNLTGQDLGGKTLQQGVYKFNTSAGLTGALTLDFQGLSNSAIIFEIGTTLVTASGPGNAVVNIINPGSNNALYWVVGSAATIGTFTQFQGNILGHNQIALETSATIGCGRALNEIPGPVTMDHNTISNGCSGALAGEHGLSGGTTITVPSPTGGTQSVMVPEPGTLMLFGCGLISLVAFKRS